MVFFFVYLYSLILAFGSATAGAVSGAYAAGMVEVDVYTYMAPNCEYNKNAADV